MTTLGHKARQHDDVAISTLVEVATNEDQPAAARVAAANSLLDRGHGKPVSALITLPADASAVARLTDMSDEALLAAVAAGRVGSALLAAGNREGGVPPKLVPKDVTVRDTVLPPSGANSSRQQQIAVGTEGGTPINGTFLPANRNAPLKIPNSGLFSVPEEIDELAT